MSTKERAQALGLTVPAGTDLVRSVDEAIANNAIGLARLIDQAHARVDALAREDLAPGTPLGDAIIAAAAGAEDPAVAALVDSASATRTALDGRYVTDAELVAAIVATAITDAELDPAVAALLASATATRNALDARYAAGASVVSHTSAAGYPAPATGVSAETVIDRIVIPAAPFARVAHLDAHVYLAAVSAAVVADVRLYAVTTAGATAISYARSNLGAPPDVATASITGRREIPADTAVTLEVRVARVSGTGTVSTSISAGLSATNVLAIRA